MMVEVSFDKNRVGHIDVEGQDGGTLDIDGENSDENDSVWDWKNWFNFKDGAQRHTTNLFVRVTIPKGAEVRVEDLVGNANIGDTYGADPFRGRGDEGADRPRQGSAYRSRRFGQDQHRADRRAAAHRSRRLRQDHSRFEPGGPCRDQRFGRRRRSARSTAA